MANLLAQFPRTLEARLEQLSEARSLLLRELEVCVLDQKGYDPGPDRWSIAEIVHHLHLSEKGVATMLRRALEPAAQRHAMADQEKLQTEWERIRVLIGTRVVPAKSPPRVVPRDTPDLSSTMGLLDQSRQTLLHTLRGVNYQDLISISMPHPFEAVRVLTGAGWLSMIAHHELRHRDQIQEIRAGIRPQASKTP